MGLSIHYNGRLRNPTSLSEIIAEVKDVAEVNKWEYHVFETRFPEDRFTENFYDQNLYGICISPPKCEMIPICFLSNGRISGPANLSLYGDKDGQKEQFGLCSISVKTQFAGIEIHRIVIHLFKYLQKKYLDDLEMSDEGHYWETQDEELLQKTFDEYVDMLDNFVLSIETKPMKKGESFETYFTRLMRMIHKRGTKNT